MTHADQERTEQDREANLFAMCLLMPEEWVRMEIKKMPGGFDLTDDAKTKILAKKFGVSQTLMAVRIGQLFGDEI